ncbi:GATOR2 complex protein MIOS-like [Symsagittifera roscoffensis]|uniref:GATOR2 complex protein MIOS-like n=1 Tax=Symsagittifera roscoffensis TaxID=84072 RepID=UPI00307C51EF
MKFLSNLHFPAYLGVFLSNCDETSSICFTIKVYSDGKVTDHGVALEAKYSAVSWCWSETQISDLNDSHFLFACGLKNASISSAAAAIVRINISNFAVSLSELPPINALVKISKTQSSQETITQQVCWRPKSNNELAARVSLGNFSGIFLWKKINLNNISASEEPRQILTNEEVLQIEWPFESTLYFISTASSNTSVIKSFDATSMTTGQLAVEIKTRTSMKFDRFRSRFSIIDDGNLRVFQNNLQVHSINLCPEREDASSSQMLHEWNPAVCNQLIVFKVRQRLLILVDFFYSEATEGASHFISPLKRMFNLNLDRTVSTFCWAPWQKNAGSQLIFGSSNSKDIVPKYVPVHLNSSGFGVNFCLSSISDNCIYSMKNFEDDIASKMQRRALKNYGPVVERLPTTDVTEDEEITALWEKLEHLKKCQRSLLKSNEKLSLKSVVGIPGIVDMINNTSMHTPVDNSETKLKFFDRELDNIVYDTIIRKHCLSYCNWEFKVMNTAQLENLENYVNKVHGGNNEVGAALAWVHSRAQLCLTYLDKIPNAAFSLALSGLSNNTNSSLWFEKCRLLSIENPYLRALFGFLAKPEAPKDVLRGDLTTFPSYGGSNVKHKKRGLPAMRLEDHVAFALKLLPDRELPGYLNELTKLYTEYGDLDGLFLTGVTPRCLDLLQSYLDRSGDIQTVALILVFANSYSHHFMSQSIQWDASCLRLINEWIEEYRSLLDSWACYGTRVKFDKAARCFDADAQPSQILAACVFCSVPFNGADKKDNMRKSNHVQNFGSEPKISHCCSNCGNFLPRCAVCLQIVGTSSAHNTLTGARPKAKLSSSKIVPIAANSVDDNFLTNKTPTSSVSSSAAAVMSATKVNSFHNWFVWCNSCSHGGHASHISAWFSSHATCPVEKCKCRCSSYD